MHTSITSSGVTGNRLATILRDRIVEMKDDRII